MIMLINSVHWEENITVFIKLGVWWQYNFLLKIYILFIVSGYMTYGYGIFSICIYKICMCICLSSNLILSIRGNCKM